MIHTTFYTGSKIRLVMKDGRVIIAKYKEKKKGKTIVTDKGKFLIKDIRAADYYKPLPHELRNGNS